MPGQAEHSQGGPILWRFMEQLQNGGLEGQASRPSLERGLVRQLLLSPSSALGPPGKRLGQETVVRAPAVPPGGAGGWEAAGRTGFLSPLTALTLGEGVGWTFENAFG